MSNEELLIHLIMNEEPERVEAPYKRNESAYSNYVAAIFQLTSMIGTGKLSFEYDDPNENYSLHCIYVKFNYSEDYDVEFDEEETKIISNIIGNVDGLIIDKGKDNNDYWQLSSVLYETEHN